MSSGRANATGTEPVGEGGPRARGSGGYGSAGRGAVTVAGRSQQAAPPMRGQSHRGTNNAHLATTDRPSPTDGACWRRRDGDTGQ